MIHVFDNALPEQKLESIQSKMWNYPTGDTWFDFGSDEDIEFIVDLARQYFDLSGAIGYEMHRNDHTPFPHFDKDEMLYQNTGKIAHPLCGIVFYPYEKNLINGHITFDEIAVKPKVNRLIVFRGDLFHSGVQHIGTRVSIGINPWSKKPLQYL